MPHASRITINMDDLERFWCDIFSEDTALIARAWSMLDAAERDAVVAHLRSIASDADRHADQRRAARVALGMPHPLAPSPGDDAAVTRRAGTEVSSPLLLGRVSSAQEARKRPRGEVSHILLASGSPRRRELIALLGLPFDVALAGVDETAQPGEDPAAMAVRLSRTKGSAVQPTLRLADRPVTRRIILSADTTVSLDAEALGKPRDAAEVRSMLTRLRGRSHQVFTAITLIDLTTGRQITDLASTDVPMRDYGDDEIEAYIASGDPFDKAGGYAIQNPGFNPVADMRGCYANVVGLPLCHVTRSLRALGIEPPADVPSACQAHLHYTCPVFRSILSEGET